MKCPMCLLSDAQIGVLCPRCRDALVGPVAITQEQIQRCGPEDAVAALVDVWGGLHRLSLLTAIGRTIEPPAITVLEPSVSRRHAIIERTRHDWRVRDLGSAHGTYVDDVAAAQPLAIRSGQQLRVGVVRFYFLEDASGIEAPQSPSSHGQTYKPSKPLTLRAIGLGTRELGRLPLLPTMTVNLHEPTGGGGGVVEVEGKQLQLTLAQYELVALLVQRMVDRAHDPEDVRGFFSPGELVRMLSLDSTQADDDNIRHLVQRVRRACTKAGLPDLIETKYGLGYRLSIHPRSR